MIVGMLTISPGYYAVLLDRTNTRCIVFETNIEALQHHSSHNGPLP
jgi:hypothetical protein